jgi:hypothetical protein
LYPSLCSRSFTFHQRYRYPPFSAASLIACWTVRQVIARSALEPALGPSCVSPTPQLKRE